MKRILLIVIAVCLPILSSAQPLSIRKAFHRYGKEEGVTKICLPGIVMDVASLFVDDDETAKMVRGINKIKILTTESKEGWEGPNLGDIVLQKFKPKAFEEMLTVRSDNEDVAILVKNKKRNKKEFLIIAGDEEDSTILYLKGRINPEMFNQLGKEMKIDALKNI